MKGKLRLSGTSKIKSKAVAKFTPERHIPFEVLESHSVIPKKFGDANRTISVFARYILALKCKSGTDMSDIPVLGFVRAVDGRVR